MIKLVYFGTGHTGLKYGQSGELPDLVWQKKETKWRSMGWVPENETETYTTLSMFSPLIEWANPCKLQELIYKLSKTENGNKRENP